MWMCGALGWALLLLLLHTVRAQRVEGVRVQADGVPTNDSLVTWAGREVPELRQVSLCVYIRFLRGRDSADSILSYALPSSFNELYLDKYVATEKLPITLLRWWRFCFVLNYETQSYIIYWNERVITGSLEGPEKLRGGGLLVLGQDQDEVGGGYIFKQSLNAVLGDLRIYDRTLNESEARDFVNCRPTSHDPKPLMDFSDLENDWILKGSVEGEQLNLTQICKQQSTFLITFPEERSFSQAAATCHSVGGSLSVPNSLDENQAILTSLRPYLPECRDANGYGTFLGVISRNNNRSYQHYDADERIIYQNFDSTFSEDSSCVSYDVTPGREGLWNSAQCELKLCTICSFSTVTHLQVRGLCEASLLDKKFLVLGEVGEKPVFRGYTYSQLQWTNGVWTLTYLPDPHTIATMIAEYEGQYPVGRRQWVVKGDKCSFLPDSKQSLVLSACQEGEYTCDDGSCVNIDQRCDLLSHCPDLSDEIDCKTVQVPETYIGELPPPLSDGSPVPVSVLVNITSMRDFSLLDLRISFDMVLVFTWRDSRLTFIHLRENLDQNPVREGARLWRPEVFLEDGAGSRVDKESRSRQTLVRRASLAKPDVSSRLKEDQQFEGSGNDLVEIRTVTVRSACQFDLAMYPFDVQACEVLVRSYLGAGSLTLRSEGIHFLGGRRLLEYYVDEVRAEEGVKEGKTHITIFLIFYNLYKYYICGTYVPTTLLLIITYLTFFFTLDDFTDRIMVSLTALMVMAALFLQTSQAMPRTAYLKLVDIWFVFCIILKFVIVLWLVVINVVRQEEQGRKRRHVEPVKIAPLTSNSAANDKAKANTSTARRLNTLGQIIIPIGFFCFVFSYLGYTLAHRHD